MSQRSRPDADDYAGGWSPLPLWARLGGPAPDDSDPVSSPPLPPDASFVVHLAPPAAPIAGPAEDARQPHALVVRLDGTCCTSAVVALVDTVAGADRWVKSQRFCLEPGFRDYEMQLSYREAALIEDYSALKVVVMASGEAPGCSCSCPSSSSSSSESSSGSSSASSSSSGSSSSGPSSSESASSGSSSASSSGQGSSSGSNSASASQVSASSSSSSGSASHSSASQSSGSASQKSASASENSQGSSSSSRVGNGCCPEGTPTTLYLTVTGDCAALNGSYTLVYDQGDDTWYGAAGNGTWKFICLGQVGGGGSYALSFTGTCPDGSMLLAATCSTVADSCTPFVWNPDECGGMGNQSSCCSGQTNNVIVTE